MSHIQDMISILSPQPFSNHISCNLPTLESSNNKMNALAFIFIFIFDLFQEHINSYLKSSFHEKVSIKKDIRKIDLNDVLKQFLQYQYFIAMISWIEKRTYLQNENQYTTLYVQTLYMVYS